MGSTDTRYSVPEVRLYSSVDEPGPSITTWDSSPREQSAGRKGCGGRGAGKLPVRPQPGSGSTGALGHQAVTEGKSSPRASNRATPTLLSRHTDCHPWAFIPALTLHEAGRGPPLTSLGTPPLDGRHTTWYLRGGCGAGVQDRWTLEEVTWLRTRLVGVKAGPRVGAPTAGVPVGGEGRWLTAPGDGGVGVAGTCSSLALLGGHFWEGQGFIRRGLHTRWEPWEPDRKGFREFLKGAISS